LAKASIPTGVFKAPTGKRHNEEFKGQVLGLLASVSIVVLDFTFIK